MVDEYIDLENEEEHVNEWQERPRRSSQGDINVTRRDLTRLMRREIISQQCHDEAAGYEILLDGVPSYEGDDEQTELVRAVEKLVQILPEFKREYIKDTDQLYTPNLDGTYPLKVSIKYPSIVKALTERARVDPKFAWFRPSRSKEMRKKIAYEQREVDRLNSNLPPNSSTKWEVLFMGVGVIRRRVPNPDYVPLRNEQAYSRPTGSKNGQSEIDEAAEADTEVMMKTLNISPSS